MILQARCTTNTPFFIFIITITPRVSFLAHLGDHHHWSESHNCVCDIHPLYQSELRLAGCCTGTMEQKSPKEESTTTRGQESYQRRMWKNFQERTKPWLSPKLGSERRGAGGAEGSKKESGLWMFKRKKKQLDRVFSSSQPNLCSTPARFEGDKKSDAVPGTSRDGQPLLQSLSAASGTSGSKPELTAHGSPKLPMSQLITYQHKSSSLGSACFEKLVVEPAAVVMGEEDQLRKNASDSVSKNTCDEKKKPKQTLFCQHQGRLTKETTTTFCQGNLSKHVVS